LPADELLLTEFVAFLAKSIKYASIKIYLAAVRHYHIRRGFHLHMHKMLRLQLVLRGIKRSQGDQIRVRLPNNHPPSEAFPTTACNFQYQQF
jgi:hypothetical protein